jgi:hypothetical protein
LKNIPEKYLQAEDIKALKALQNLVLLIVVPVNSGLTLQR